MSPLNDAFWRVLVKICIVYMQVYKMAEIFLCLFACVSYHAYESPPS